jgi:hypothetical protein
MTRILVLSDTHLTHGGQSPGDEPSVLKDLAGYIQAADLVLHAGDHTGVGFYQALQRLNQLISVCGNMDAPMLRDELPERTLLEREGVRIGMIHGWGSSQGLGERVFDAWSGEKPDVIVFGHSHRVHNGRRGKVLLFNPGSPTEPSGPHPTAGWIEINQGQVQASIIHLPKHGRFP